MQAAFLASGGVASLAALLRRRKEPAVLAATLAAITAFVRAAVAADGTPGGRNGLRAAAAAAPQCGRARISPVASTVEAGSAMPSIPCADGAPLSRRAAGSRTSAQGAAPTQLRTSSVPLMLALDDGLVAAVVLILRRRTPNGAVESELALPALQLISSIVAAKASARQLLRCRCF